MKERLVASAAESRLRLASSITSTDVAKITVSIAY